MLLAVQNEREWARFCAGVLRRPELAADPRFDANSRRVANRAELDVLISAAFAPLTREDIVARLEAARIAYGRISSIDDLSRHPQNRYVEIDTPAGPVRMLGSGILHDGAAVEPGPVPALGQHTQAVLAEFARQTA